MPIRMTDDDPGDDSGDSGDSGGSGGGGGGGGGNLGALVDLLFFAFRHPILTLVVCAVGGVVYLVSGRGHHPTSHVASASKFGTGATLDPKVYDTALVHEPLADGRLPAKVSLLDEAPPRGDQGHQGSCVGWATSYAARSILYARQSGVRPDAAEFSPSFAYNQVARPGCNGTHIVDALNVLERVGDLPLASFAYDQDSCDHEPSRAEREAASKYRIAGYDRLTVDTGDYRTNALAVKQNLAQGAPVVIGMDVGGTFQTAMDGQRVWHPTADDWAEKGDFGGHALAVIGYDDTLEGGAFQIMNSWGEEWGDHGVAYVRYKDFSHFVKEAYGLYPMGDARARDGRQTIRFGLVENKTHRELPLVKVDPVVFRTAKPIHKGTRFKVEVANTRPCFTYLFGQDTDGSSYVLFPYTPKNSPYCGIVGTRIFPRRQSLTADDVGTRDSVAVVIAQQAMDPQALNAKINAQAGATYADKLKAALGDAVDTHATTRVKGDQIELAAAGGDPKAVQLLVLEFDKI